jgi:predicted ester cyclase
MDIPPAGKKVTLRGRNVLRIENGKIAEDWVIWDDMGMRQQLGVAPGRGMGRDEG